MEWANYGIRACREALIEVDNENAFINIGMLEENDTYVTRILNEAFDQLSVDEKLEKYPLGMATPLIRYLFMV